MVNIYSRIKLDRNGQKWTEIKQRGFESLLFGVSMPAVLWSSRRIMSSYTEPDFIILVPLDLCKSYRSANKTEELHNFVGFGTVKLCCFEKSQFAFANVSQTTSYSPPIIFAASLLSQFMQDHSSGIQATPHLPPTSKETTRRRKICKNQKRQQWK